MRIVRRKGWLRFGIVVGSLLGMSWATLSKQGGQSAASGQAASAQKVDWGIFLPAGEGQLQTAVYCSSCHTFQVIVTEQGSDEAGWMETVQTMVYMNGASIQEDDMAVISKYLARAFGPSKPKFELPIHINTAPEQILALLRTLSSTDVQKIIDARSKEKLRDFAALEAVVGNEKLAKYKSAISFD